MFVRTWCFPFLKLLLALAVPKNLVSKLFWHVEFESDLASNGYKWFDMVYTWHCFSS